ncbi:Zinc finger, GRF-type [Sesbania bispinosa]|nr:Zinc finger, GRF-type [Sesbania bispinosa]
MDNSASSGSSSFLSSIHHDSEQFCKCGVQCKMMVSQTVKNPGRRFLGCGNYNGSSSHCDFFYWYDPPATKHCTKVFSGLTAKNENLMAELKSLKETMLVLQQKLEIEKADKNELALKVEAYRKKSVNLKIMICVILIPVLANLLDMY